MPNPLRANPSPANEWRSLIKRLQSCGRDGRAVIVSVTCVIVDGKLRHWTRPTIQPIEPASSADQFIEMLVDLDRKT